jgi:hypothetical protein
LYRKDGGEMSKPWEHAILSAKKFGGKPDDYLKIHDFMDSSKAHVADMRHRAILHSSFGIYLAERVFGTNIVVHHETDPSRPCMEQHIVSVRAIAEQHVIQDVGFIPSVQQYLDHMELAEWMGGKKKKSFTITLKAQVKPERQPSPWTLSMLMKASAQAKGE